MTQPTREHRHDIHPRVCLSYGVVSHILWRQALDARQPVGTCTADRARGVRCGGLMLPGEPELRGQRWHYPAQCATCRREVEGKGPRPVKGGEG